MARVQVFVPAEKADLRRTDAKVDDRAVDGGAELLHLERHVGVELVNVALRDLGRLLELNDRLLGARIVGIFLGVHHQVGAHRADVVSAVLNGHHHLGLNRDHVVLPQQFHLERALVDGLAQVRVVLEGMGHVNARHPELVLREHCHRWRGVHTAPADEWNVFFSRAKRALLAQR